MKEYKTAVFAGTTEGREVLNFLAEKPCDVVGFCATEYSSQMQIDSRVKIQIGRLNQVEMREKFTAEKFDFVIDATHPHAVEVSKNIAAACSACNVKYIRISRQMHDKITDEMVEYFSSIKEVCEFLKNQEGNIFLSTGSKNLAEFSSAIAKERLFARVLPCVESINLCEAAGIIRKQIFACEGPFSVEINIAMLQSANAKFLVTKQTGNAGGFLEKVQAAKRAGAVLCVVCPDNLQSEQEKNAININEFKEFFKGVLKS